MTSSPHLRGIVIAGVLAVVALGLGFVTLSMNQTASKAAPVVIHKHVNLRALAGAKGSAAKAAAKPAAAKPAKPAAPRPDVHYLAALHAGLPSSVARALAKAPIAVVEVMSPSDPVAQLATGDAKAGAALAGASFVAVDIDHDGAQVSALARALGSLPTTPATLVYVRPGTEAMTLTGYNDRTTVEQAVESARASEQASAPATPAAAASGSKVQT